VRENFHKHIYLAGLCLVAFFLPLSEYITNAAILLTITNYLIEGGYRNKINLLARTKSLLIFLLIFGAHLVWLINTENFNFAFTDLRIKLPLLALPVVIATSRSLTSRQINSISLIFIGGVLLSTLSGLFSKFGILFEQQTDNVRNYSIFVSHIRLSLMICLSVLILFYFISRNLVKNKLFLIGSLIVILWFIGFLIIIQGFTGLSALIIVGLLAFGFRAYREQKRTIKFIMFGILIIAPLSILLYLGVQIKRFYTPEDKEQKILQFTAGGNLYYTDTTSLIIENGNYIYRNICEKELQAAWNKRSRMNLSGKDLRGQSLLHTLIRYLTSKGLNKDAEGVAELSDKDIMNIENGKTNYRFIVNGGISQRIYNILWQLDVYAKGSSPSGHSITQRFEYLKYGLILAKRNFWFGTGSGDIDDEYKSLYIERRSTLEPQYRHRAHNQYLTFYVSFGVLGAIICLIAWFYPVFSDYKTKSYYFLVFFLIASLSMLTDDTMETTTGVVFISYFYSLYLWGKKES
jgi:O-antigen ligase